MSVAVHERMRTDLLIQTTATVGPLCLTHRLTEADEQQVDLTPQFFWYELFDLFLCLYRIGRFRAHPAETIADSVHMHVDGNARALLPRSQHDQMRHFRADTGQLAQILN